MRFPLALLPVVAVVVGCSSNSAAPVAVAPAAIAVVPTGAPTPAATRGGGTAIVVTRAESAYVTALSRAVALVPDQVPASVGGQKIAPARVLDFMAGRVAQARAELQGVTPSPRLAPVDARFKTALNDLDRAVRDAKAALAARDKTAFEDASKRIIGAKSRVDQTRGGLLEAVKAR